MTPVRTIDIAVEDRFVAVKFTEQFLSPLRQINPWHHQLNESPLILRDLLMYGLGDQYTLLCDCRHIQILNDDDHAALPILKLCEAGIPVICGESSRNHLEAYARTYSRNRSRVLGVRHGQSPLNYVPVAAALFENPVEYSVDGGTGELVDFPDVTPEFKKAAGNFSGIGSAEERNFATTFAKAHYDLEAEARGYFDAEYSERERDKLTQQDSTETVEGFECGSGEDDDRLDLECERDYFEDLYAVSAVASLRALRSVVRNHALNSLLVEYAVQMQGSGIFVTPYHSHAIHSIEARNEVALGRPAVIAERTASLLASQIHEFEILLSKSRIREVEIQRFLEANPALLRALGYSQVYPQVVLQRDNGTFLRPDFIVQPTSDEWCDIIDIKLPRMRTVVGIRDRKTLSAAIHGLIAQLREYKDYFDDEKLSRRLEKLYGIKCYRPRLVGVIGTDPRLADERQVRRLMTAYSDVKVLTFDQLLRHAKSRLLI